MDSSLLMDLMLTDDGNTLLALRQAEDGSLELLSTPVTIVQNVQNVPDNSLQILNTPNYDDILCQNKVNYIGPNENPPNLTNAQHILNQKDYHPPDITNNPIQKVPLQNCTNVQNNTKETPPVQEETSSKKLQVSVSSKEVPNSIQKSSQKKSARKDLEKLKQRKKIKDKEIFLKCDICGEEFNKQYLLQKHLHDHAQEKPYHCPKCPASFNVPTNFSLHMATHCIGEPKCPKCGRKFARMASLKSHMLTHEVDENLYCTDCDAVFQSKVQLEAHLKLHNEKWSSDEYRKCKLCHKQFTQSGLYRQHLRDHYKLQTKTVKQTNRGIRHRTQYKCKICMKVFEKPSQLARHIRVHTGEKPYKCNLCNRSFTQKGSLRIHMGQHNGLRPYSCSYCQAKFSQKGNLNGHILRVHKVQRGVPMYQCTQCPCIFKKLGSLNCHMKRSHNVDGKNSNMEAESEAEEFVEEECKENSEANQNEVESSEKGSNEAKTSQILPNETSEQPSDTFEDGFIMLNDTDQTAVVTLLDKSTNDEKGKYVRIKQRFVNNCRVYVCSYCDKIFKKPSDLIRHLRIHTQEKPFQCSVCSKSFTLKSTMQTHEKTHKEVKKFSCCSISFISKLKLRTHEKFHHNKCSICDKKFQSFDELKSHSVIHGVRERNKSERNKSEKSRKRKISCEPAVQNLAKNIVLKEPLVLTEASNGLLHVQPKFRNEIAHGKGRPHKCFNCPAAFMKLSHLKQHQRMHTGEKPFVCNICDRTFSTNSTLKTHVRTHDSAKPYECSICKLNFSTLSSMKRHRFTHSNKRPYMCPYCNKTFKTTVNCKKHMKIHKEELAQQQLELQKNQQEPSTLNKQEVVAVSETIPNTKPSTKPVLQSKPIDITKNLNEHLQTMVENNEKSAFCVSTSLENSCVLEQTLPVTTNSFTSVTQTYNADATGMVTIPDCAADQTFTAENIKELEETLNQQLLNIGMNLRLNNCNNVVFENGDQPVLNIIYDNAKTLTSPMDTNMFNSQLDNFDPISIQNENIIDLGPVQTNLTNVAGILSEPIQINQHNITQWINYDYEMQIAQNQSNKQNYTDPLMPELKTIIIKDSYENINNESNLQCHVCNIKNLNVDDLKNHLKTHQVNREFKCKYCDSKFCTSGDLSKHIKIHESQETHKCYECNEVFRTTLQLREHIKEHVKRELILKNEAGSDEIILDIESKHNETGKKKCNKCNFCPKTFRKPSDLVRHTRTHTGERPYQCEFCIKSFAVKCTLDSHLKVHNGEKSFTCNLCNSMFATKGSLKVHMRLHTGSKPFKCSMCDMRFRTSGHRKVHFITHMREQSSTSRKSNKQSPVSALKVNAEKAKNDKSEQDVEIAHTETAPQQLVDDNEKNFNTITINSISDQIVYNMDGTIINDSGEVLTLDENNQLVANLEFLLANGLVTIQTENSSLEPHLTESVADAEGENFIPANVEQKIDQQIIFPEIIRTEISNETLAVANDGNFQADNSMTLQLQNVDSTVSDNQDEVSSKNAKSPSTAKRDCDICGKAFKKPCQVERHMRTHTGERPFKCKMCDKSFAQKSTLQMHEKHHTGDRPYTCSQCNKSFSQSGNLRTHLKRVHKLNLTNSKGLSKNKQFVNYDPQLLQQSIEETKVLNFDDISIVGLLE